MGDVSLPVLVWGTWTLLAMLMLLPVMQLAVALRRAPESPLGEVLLAFVWEHPVLIFAAGVIVGHVFWRG